MPTDKVKSRTGDVRDNARARMDVAEDVTRGIVATFSNQVVPVEEIDGVGPAYAEALAKAGVVTTRALIERCDSPEAIERLAGQTGITAGMIEGWAADAELTRVDGIGPAHMNLLNAIGVGAVSQLAKQEPADLCKRALDLDGRSSRQCRPRPCSETGSRRASSETRSSGADRVLDEDEDDLAETLRRHD